ncbi:MAG: hypothetical protein OSA99_10540, partial [Acidimicrobiales bacterium]|nr:hypothetical protein [Acidimicrobiales bacterium]
GQQVTTERPAPVSPSELKASIARSDETTTTVPDNASTTSPDPTTTTTGLANSQPTLGSGQPTAPTNGTGTPQTTAPPASSPPSTTATTPTTQPPAVPATTRTYSLTGGSVSLRFASSGVTVNYATPNAGFEVSIEPEHGNGVKVEFRGDSHRSRVDGWWENGPVDRIREEPD